MNNSKLGLCICILIFSIKGFAQSFDQQLFEAVKQNNLKVVQKIINKGADINKPDENGATPIMWAAYKTDLALVKFLISKGADFKKKGIIYLDPEKALYYGSLTAIASGEGKLDIVKFLIEDCNINIDDKEYNAETKTDSGWTALHWATYKNRTEIIDYLLSKDANINSQDNIGWTPLMLAAYSQDTDLYQYLLSQGADKTLVNNQGKTAGNILIGSRKAIDVDINQAVFLYKNGKYSDAADLFAKWLPMVKEEYGENDTVLYLDLLSYSGKFYYEAGLAEKAETLIKEAIRIDSTTLGKHHPSYCRDLNILALIYQATTRYEQAEILMKAVLNNVSEYQRFEDPDYSTYLYNLALLYYIMGKNELSESLILESLQIDKETQGDNHPYYARKLNILALIYQSMGKFEEAEPLQKEAIRITKESVGENNPEYSTYLSNLFLLYNAMGRYEDAEPLIKEAIRIDKAVLGEHHPSYGRDLNNLALLYQSMDRYEEAAPLEQEAIRILKESKGENHPDYARGLNNLALLYQAMGHYEQAEPLMKEAIHIDKETIGVYHPDYAKDLNNLALLYTTIGLYDQAESLFIQALRIAKESLGEYHPDYSQYINNLAQLYASMGRFEQAEPMMEDGIRITKKSLGEHHPSYATGLSNLALLYFAMGRFDQAEPLMKESLQIIKESLGENNPSYANCLNNLAKLYEELYRYEQAELLYKQAIEIDKIQLGVNHPDYANVLNNLAQLYLATGHDNQAEQLMIETVTIIKKSLGEHHPNYARYLNNLAELYKQLGKNEQSEPLMLEALQIAKENGGENHPNYSLILNNLALLYQDLGLYEQAYPLLKEAYSNLKDNFIENNGYLSEAELNQYTETFLYYLDIYQSFNYHQLYTFSEDPVFAMDIELFRKGLLLNSVIETRRKINDSGDTGLINSYNTMLAYRKQVAKLYSIPAENRFENPAFLDEKANELEKGLKMRSQAFNQSVEEVEIIWMQIREKLKPGEAAVEFFTFDYNDKVWTDSTLYCALVLRKQDTVPQMVYLFEEKQLAEAFPKQDNNSDADINNTYAALRGGQLLPDSSFNKGENLYNLVWKPLDSLLSGIKTVNYACSGLLNAVSFAAISDASGKLLCEKYSLNQYSSTRNLAIETKNLPITVAAIYGGIQYELDTTLMIANSRQYSISDSFALAYNSSRSGNKRGNGFDELEGTREEANAISILFKEKKITTNNYSGAAANEESFKAMAEKKSPSVIHLSTHGFYYPDTTAQRKRSNEMQFIGSDLNRFQYSPDPLLRSGIVLAGANRVWRGEPVPDGVEDGILTAKDVSQLNLSNTQLVVLSACQTGLGDVKGSEGVFGLQRAFKMAGVRYLIMSLWSVPDKETTEFMEKFYTNWLSDIPIRQAFQTTQQEMRVKYPKEPYKWAAFVLVE